MSWEAFRWTAKTPSELYHVLGSRAVDDLIHQAISACWRQLPGESRSLESGQQAAREVFSRHVKVWSAIKKPSPEKFFQDMGVIEADGFMRQAMVMCWMMMPRTGGRDVADVKRIITDIFERNMAAWEQDEATFTGKPKKKTTKKSTRKPAKPAGKSPAKKRKR